MEAKERAAAPRTERILPGIWRLRLPLPWPGVSHVNSWALASAEGIVLVDAGLGGEGRMRQFDVALGQLGFSVADVRLLVCTHSHADHYGLAATIVERAGCEIWMHPAWDHVRPAFDDPAATLERRVQLGRANGVPEDSLRRFREWRGGDETGFDAIVEPHRELLPGVEVETDHGAWQVYETPGHAPSHVVLHQPERRLLISGDHLLGHTALFFDYGHTPDPVGEFLGGLETIEPLAVDLCLPGHGRPFRETPSKIEAVRGQVEETKARVRAGLGEEQRTAYELVAEWLGPENLDGPVSLWMLQIALAMLDHMELAGEVGVEAGGELRRWSVA